MHLQMLRYSQHLAKIIFVGFQLTSLEKFEERMEMIVIDIWERDHGWDKWCFFDERVEECRASRQTRPDCWQEYEHHHRRE